MGRGVYYGAAPGPLTGKHVAIVGGANSAGQAAVKAAHSAASVSVIARSAIRKQMSSYLVDRLQAASNVQILEGAEVVRVGGTTRLEVATVRQKNRDQDLKLDALMIFIGAIPHTAWLPDIVRLSPKRYIITDSDLDPHPGYPCMTSVKGVFAAGDVRHGQGVKRITGAVFDGACAIQSVHRYLAEVG
jgi:thioredoxin reductase (NADPH)